jgi:hypothetical protein
MKRLRNDWETIRKRLCPGLTEHCKFICWVFSKYIRILYKYISIYDDWISDGDLPTPGVGHKMSAIEVSEDEVECAFLDLDVNKGPSPDGITPAILTRLASVVKVPLTFVFNLSLSAGPGVFPAIWKESFVVPLFKSGDKRDVSCYRRISILSAIPKLFEEMVCDRITPVVRSVISDAQHVFVKGHSTVSNLVQFMSEIEKGW